MNRKPRKIQISTNVSIVNKTGLVIICDVDYTLINNHFQTLMLVVAAVLSAFKTNKFLSEGISIMSESLDDLYEDDPDSECRKRAIKNKAIRFFKLLFPLLRPHKTVIDKNSLELVDGYIENNCLHLYFSYVYY